MRTCRVLEERAGATEHAGLGAARNLAKLKERRRDARVPAKILPANTPHEVRIIGDFGTDMDSSTDYALVMSLRLAVLLHRNRSDIELPSCRAVSAAQVLPDDGSGLAGAEPLTEAALLDEVKQWKALGLAFISKVCDPARSCLLSPQ